MKYTLALACFIVIVLALVGNSYILLAKSKLVPEEISLLH